MDDCIDLGPGAKEIEKNPSKSKFESPTEWRAESIRAPALSARVNISTC